MRTVNRRGFVTGFGVGSAALAVTGSRAHVARRASPTAGGDFAAEVDAGLTYFRQRAAEQRTLAEDLVRAIAGGDLVAAQAAYVASRPPYEEIEVHAASFPQTDADLDARPYAFDEGETSAEFRGFHRIEALLYRDGDPAAAAPFADGVVASVDTLLTDLDRRENFSAAGHFDGMIALANEVASKKISSEEETWSDQSLLIFRFNWEGIYSQYEPFGLAVSAVDPTLATEVDTAYGAARDLVSSYFTGDSPTATPYSDIAAAERGAIVRASYRLRDALIAARAALAIA